MDIINSTQIFAALAQEIRLRAVKLLVEAGPAGLRAGELSDTLGVRQNTLSANLAVLLGVGLVWNRQEGRVIRYFADYDQIGSLLGFMLTDCCDGHPAVYKPVLEDLRKL